MEAFPVAFPNGAGRQFHKPLAKILPLRFPMQAFQAGKNGSMVFLPHYPQVRHSCPAHRFGVRHVKNIGQARPAPGILPDQSNAFGPWLYPPAHLVIP